MKIEPVSDTRSATLFLIAGAVKPFKPCVVFNEIHDWGFNLFLKNYLVQNESANTAVPFAPCPNNEDISERPDLNASPFSKQGWNSRNGGI